MKCLLDFQFWVWSSVLNSNVSLSIGLEKTRRESKTVFNDTHKERQSETRTLEARNSSMLRCVSTCTALPVSESITSTLCTWFSRSRRIAVSRLSSASTHTAGLSFTHSTSAHAQIPEHRHRQWNLVLRPSLTVVEVRIQAMRLNQ